MMTKQEQFAIDWVLSDYPTDPELDFDEISAMVEMEDERICIWIPYMGYSGPALAEIIRSMSDRLTEEFGEVVQSTGS